MEMAIIYTVEDNNKLEIAVKRQKKLKNFQLFCIQVFFFTCNIDLYYFIFEHKVKFLWHSAQQTVIVLLYCTYQLPTSFSATSHPELFSPVSTLYPTPTPYS